MDDKQKSCGSCTTASCTAKNPRQGETPEEFEDRQKLLSRLCKIKHKVLVLSGKGGVGKSTVATNMALSLSMAGKSVGLLDVDIHGPSIPTMLNLQNTQLQHDGTSIFPVMMNNIKVMSIGFLLPHQNEAAIWRGPMKMHLIKQFLRDVDWGDLDYLIMDLPPGTGDEPLSICQLIENADGAIIVTTPQEVAVAAVRRSVTFCRTLHLPVLGIIENMSGFVCPKCGEITEIFKIGGGKEMADAMKVPFLGCIPIEAQIGISGDNGQPYIGQYPDTETAKAFSDIIQAIL